MSACAQRPRTADVRRKVRANYPASDQILPKILNKIRLDFLFRDIFFPDIVQE